MDGFGMASIVVAGFLIMMWLVTHWISAIYGIQFNRDFLSQLGNLALFAAGMLGISQPGRRTQRQKERDQLIDEHLSSKCKEKKKKNDDSDADDFPS